MGSPLDEKTKRRNIKSYFESDDVPWEGRYDNDRVEASMYGDRNRAGLALAGRFVSSGSRVLEIGSGPGYLSRELQDMDYDVVSCDLALRMASKTRARMNRDSVVVADVHALPFQPETFDAIVLVGVISYVTDPADVLRKLRNLLKPDGILLISSANTNLFFISIRDS